MNTITCVIAIIGSLVTPCPQAARPSPAEAVAVLTASIQPFVYLDRGDGPQAFILPYDGPYDPPQAPIQPLSAPWSSAWYDGRSGYGGGLGSSYGHRGGGLGYSGSRGYRSGYMGRPGQPMPASAGLPYRPSPPAAVHLSTGPGGSGGAPQRTTTPARSGHRSGR